MAAKYWIKLYHEILDDPKMCRLPDHLYRRTIELFLLAGKTGDDGSLPDVPDTAWHLRIEEAQLLQDLQDLSLVGIVTQDDDGWFVTKIAERQEAVSGAERIQRYRERQKKERYYGNDSVTQDVTKRYTEPEKNQKRVEVEVEPERAKADDDNGHVATPEKEPEKLPAYQTDAGKVFQAWSMARGGSMNPLDNEHLGHLIDDYGVEWCVEAIHEANQARTHGLINVNFVKAILERWKSEGFKAPREPPEKRADENAEKREMAARVRKELLAEGVPRDRVEAAIEKRLGKGF